MSSTGVIQETYAYRADGRAVEVDGLIVIYCERFCLVVSLEADGDSFDADNTSAALALLHLVGDSKLAFVANLCQL